MYKTDSSILTAVGVVVAVVAVVGAQFLGWEWGGGQPGPTLIGLAVATIAVAVAAIQLLR